MGIYLCCLYSCVSSAIVFHSPVFQNIFHMLRQSRITDAVPHFFPQGKGKALFFYKKAFAGGRQEMNRHGLGFAQMLAIRHSFILFMGYAGSKIFPIGSHVEELFPTGKHFLIRYRQPDITVVVETVK